MKRVDEALVLEAAADKVSAEIKPELAAIAARGNGLDKTLANDRGKHPDPAAFDGIGTGPSALTRHR